MPPRRNPNNVADQIAQQLNAAIPNLVAQITASLNAAQGNPEGQTANNNQGCSYKTFMSCRPKEFFGTEGVVGLLSWIESMESVLHISKCAAGDRVEYAACMLQGRALTWWNNQIQSRGREASYSLTWEEFKKLLTEEYCPKDALQKLESEFWNHSMTGTNIDQYTARFHELARLVPHMVTPEEKKIDRYIWGLAPEIRGMVTAANPTTIQSAVVLANRLTNDVIRSGGALKGNDAGKRKLDNHSRQRGGGNSDKRQMVARNFGMAAQGPKQYNGPHPRCNKCHFHHSGNCPVCERCKQTGHFAKYCRVGNGNNRPKAACFECGSQEHLKNACPKLIRTPNNNVGN
jgi:hypothetical protein